MKVVLDTNCFISCIGKKSPYRNVFDTSLHSIFYNFLLVHGDEDDNKFADIYLSANADYLISNDSKLLALRTVAFPTIQVITLQEFSLLLSTGSLS